MAPGASSQLFAGEEDLDALPTHGASWRGRGPLHTAAGSVLPAALWEPALRTELLSQPKGLHQDPLCSLFVTPLSDLMVG